MFNPFVNNLDELNDIELEKKISDITKHYFRTNNIDLKQQLAVLLEMHNEELRARREKAWKEQYEKRDKGLDDLINID